MGACNCSNSSHATKVCPRGLTGMSMYSMRATPNLGVSLLRHIIHLWPQARVAHRKVVLGAMAGAVGAFAPRLATSFVAFDEGAAEDCFERGQLAQESFAAFSQCGSGRLLHSCQTTYITGLIVNHVFSFVNPIFEG